MRTRARYTPKPTLDAAESVYFSRQLEVIRPKTYDVKYEDLRAREFLPVNNSDNPGLSVITYRQYDRVGMAKIINSYADDLPRVDVTGKEFSALVKSMGDSYGYSVDEIRKARFTGQSLDQRKADAARRAYEELFDRIATSGDAASGLKGLLNIANAQTYAVANGASGFADWARKTAAEIVADCIGAWKQMRTNTRGKEVPNMFLLPDTAYTQAASRQFSVASEKSILTYIQELPMFRGVTFDTWFSLAGAGAGGTDRAVLYRKDSDAIEAVEPLPFLQHPEQPRLLEFIVPCEGKTAGVICYYPMSVMYIDGI